MSDIPPHVARLIRDKTLKAVSKSNSEALESLKAGFQPPSKVPTTTKVVRVLTAHCYKLMCENGLGICKVMILPRGKPKKEVGFFSGWYSGKGRLIASCSAMFRRGNEVDSHGVLDIEITRHALERVSERLGTIAPDELRNELIPVVTSVLFHAISASFSNGEYSAKSPHGIAMIVKGSDGIIVTTWINDDMAAQSQLEGWIVLEKVNSVRTGKTTIETASQSSVFLLRSL
jgi:hypothetical protein